MSPMSQAPMSPNTFEEKSTLMVSTEGSNYYGKHNFPKEYLNYRDILFLFLLESLLIWYQAIHSLGSVMSNI